MSKNPDDNEYFLDDIDELFKKLRDINSDIIGSALFSTNGVLIRAAFTQNVNEALIGEISSRIQTNAEKSIEELSLGKLKRIIIEGEEGTIILTNAGNKAIICVIVKPDANLGMVLLNTQLLTRNIGSKNLNRGEFNQAVNSILSTMKEKETKILTFERKYLPELLTHEMLSFNTKDGLPVVNYLATVQFGTQGIHIKYDKDLVLFLKY